MYPYVCVYIDNYGAMMVLFDLLRADSYSTRYGYYGCDVSKYMTEIQI